MSRTIDNGGPAFPVLDSSYGNLGLRDPGMSLRDWFAGHIIAGWAANPNVIVQPGSSPSAAYELADAMIDARKGDAS